VKEKIELVVEDVTKKIVHTCLVELPVRRTTCVAFSMIVRMWICRQVDLQIVHCLLYPILQDSSVKICYNIHTGCSHEKWKQ